MANFWDWLSSGDNADAKKLQENIYSGLKTNVLDKGPQPYGSSLYQPAGNVTTKGWNQALGVANGATNGAYGKGVKSGTNYFAGTEANGGYAPGQQALGGQYAALGGAFDQNAPGYAEMRQKALNDAVQGVGAGFIGSGRFGGGSYVNGATDAAVNAIAPLDYANYQNSVQNKYQALDRQNSLYQQGFNNQVTGAGALSGLYDAALRPSQTIGAIGAAQDANAQGMRTGDANLWDAQHNKWLNFYGSVAGVGNTNAGGVPTTGNNTPGWMQAVGAAGSTVPWFL